MKNSAIVNSILKQLFTNGAGEKADRLILVKESRNGDARVSNAQDLGGYSKEAVRDLVTQALAQREVEE